MEDNKKDRKWRWEMQDNNDDDFMDIDISEIKEEADAHTEDVTTEIPSIDFSETTAVEEENEETLKAGERLKNYVKLSAERAEKKVKDNKETEPEEIDEPEENVKGFHIPINEGSRSSKEERQKNALQNKGGKDKKHFKSSPLAPILTIVVIIALAFLFIKLIGGDFTGPSWKEAKDNSDIYQLAVKYYEARRDGNEELMQSILDSSASVNTAELARDAKVYEKFEDIKAYSYEGLDKGEYVLCFTCQYKIYDISTMVPSLSWLYARPDAEGNLKLLTQKDMEANKDILNYAVSAANDSKFYGNIVEPVQNKYETALKGDANLKNFLVAMGSTAEGQVPSLGSEPDLRLPDNTTEAVSEAAAEPDSTEETTEAVSTEAATEPVSTEATTEEATTEEATTEEATTEAATEAPTTTASDEEDEFTKLDKNMYVSVKSVNCRKAPTTDSQVIDGFLRGDKVHVIGTNGTWYKIELEDGVGYIRGDLLSESN